MCLRMGWRLASRPFATNGEPRFPHPHPLSGRPRRARPCPCVNQAGSAAPAKGGNTKMSDVVDVAIIGAGPYGLSLAAHLQAAGVSYRHFGSPMWLWRQAMPQGMYLKSQGFASTSPTPGHAPLEAFCKATDHPYRIMGCRYRWTISSTTASGSSHSSTSRWKKSWSPEWSSAQTDSGSPWPMTSSSWRGTSSWPSASSTSPTCPGPFPRCPPRRARTAPRIPT